MHRPARIKVFLRPITSLSVPTRIAEINAITLPPIIMLEETLLGTLFTTLRNEGRRPDVRYYPAPPPNVISRLSGSALRQRLENSAVTAAAVLTAVPAAFCL